MVQINWYTLVIKRPKKLITFSFGTCISICSEAAAACAVVRPLAIWEGEPYINLQKDASKPSKSQTINFISPKETTTKIPNKCTLRKEKEWNLYNNGTYSFSALFILSNVPIISIGLVAAYGSASISHQNTIFCLWISFIKPFASFDYQ